MVLEHKSIQKETNWQPIVCFFIYQLCLGWNWYVKSGGKVSLLKDLGLSLSFRQL